MWGAVNVDPVGGHEPPGAPAKPSKTWCCCSKIVVFVCESNQYVAWFLLGRWYVLEPEDPSNHWVSVDGSFSGRLDHLEFFHVKRDLQCLFGSVLWALKKLSSCILFVTAFHYQAAEEARAAEEAAAGANLIERMFPCHRIRHYILALPGFCIHFCMTVKSHICSRQPFGLKTAKYTWQKPRHINSGAQPHQSAEAFATLPLSAARSKRKARSSRRTRRRTAASNVSASVGVSRWFSGFSQCHSFRLGKHLGFA